VSFWARFKIIPAPARSLIPGRNIHPADVTDTDFQLVSMGWMHRDHARDRDPVHTLHHVCKIRLENRAVAGILYACFDTLLSRV
jgi:hypothetical protein